MQGGMGQGRMPMGQQLSWLQNYANAHPYQGPTLPPGSPGGLPSGNPALRGSSTMPYSPQGGFQQQPSQPQGALQGGVSAMQPSGAQIMQGGNAGLLGDSMSLNPARMPVLRADPASPAAAQQSPQQTLGQSMGLSPGDPRYNLREGDSYAGGIVTRNPNGGFTIAANNASGPLAGTSYGEYINPTGSGGIGNINGQNQIFGNVYHGEGLNQDNGGSNANSGFNVFLRQQAAAMNHSMPNDPRTQQLNQYLAQLGQQQGITKPYAQPTPMGKVVPGNNPALGRGLLGR